MSAQRWMPFILLAAGLAVYANSLTGPFIFDDYNAIVDNPHVRRVWPVWDAMVAPHQSTVAGRPIVSLSLALNYAIGGYDVRGYHIFNLTIHLLSALLLLGIARRTLRRMSQPHDTPAGAVALLWLVHPLQTEAVNYIVQRTELLMAFFFLLTLYAFIRGVEGRHSIRWWGLAILACVIGLGCKEVMVAAPLVVLVYDGTFVTGSFRQSLSQRPGLYAGLASTWLLAAVLLAWGPRSETVGFGLGSVTPWQYALTQTGVLAHYLRLSVWPTPLVVDYDDWPVAHGITDVWLSVLMVLGLLALTGYGLLRRSAAGFLGAWFFLILAPTSSFVPIVTELAAERRTYLPLAAILAAFVWLVIRLQRATTRWLPGVAIGLMAVAFGAVTIARNRDYRTEVAIYEDTVLKRSGNVRARCNLGAALVRQGRFGEGMAELNRALALRPGYVDAHYNLGLALAMQQRDEEAGKHLTGVLESDANHGPAHYALGVVLGRQRHWPDAAHHFARAAKLLADPAEALCGLGGALANMGRLDQAIPLFREALRLRPDYEAAQANLDRALREQP